MLERLKKLIEENLPDKDLSNLDENSRLMADLGMDSVGMMMLSMSIEDEFGVTFNEPVNFVTVKDVLDWLKVNATK